MTPVIFYVLIGVALAADALTWWICRRLAENSMAYVERAEKAERKAGAAADRVELVARTVRGELDRARAAGCRAMDPDEAAQFAATNARRFIAQMEAEQQQQAARVQEQEPAKDPAEQPGVHPSWDQFRPAQAARVQERE